MSDRSLTCRDCGQEFVFTLGEQEFYQQRGFSEPQRCPTCRAARKTQRNGGASTGGGGYSSGGYSSGGGGGGSYSSGGGGGYGSEGGFGSSPRQLYPATCSECGQQTEVPFNPSPGKPVYCRECFSSRRAAPRYDSY
ncbi:MAG: zinc-ribbon domain containing protein [Chloroflexia bacterium]|nr:zinc-ribbon domain containing protein [Chloroflexia bacterium]